MAESEDQIRLRLTAETVGWQKAWADVRVQTARDLAQIKSTVTTSLNQTKVNAAQSLAGIRQSAAQNLSQTRVNTAQQLAQIRVNTAQQLTQIRQNAQATLGQMGSQFESAGRRLSVGLTLPLVALAAASIRSAKDVDAQRNTLIAFEGSLEAANARLLRNQALANRSVGVTRALANASFALFKGLQGVTDQTIEKTIAGVGRLNAVFSIQDLPKFQQNLGQIFNLNFNTKDIREATRAVPIFNQLLESAFGTSDPAALRKLKASGKLTIDTFLSGLSDAIERDTRLSKVQEAIGTRLFKISERVQLALAPLGDTILTLVEKGLNVLEPALTGISKGFASLPTVIQTIIVLLGGVTAAIGPTLFITGSLINTVVSLQKAYVTLNSLALIPTISNLRLLGQVVQGTASLSAGAAATTAVRFGALAAAIAAAVSVSFALTRAIDGWLASIAQAHPTFVRFASSLLAVSNPLYAILRQVGIVGPETDKVAAAQAGAVPAVRGFSGAIEEESESLKSLRRALAEVELATKSRVAAAQRAYNEERITAAQFAAERIGALEEERAAKLKQIDEDLRLARAGSPSQGVGPHGAVDADGKKLLDKIEDLEHQRKTIVSETDTEIENIRSEARKTERENEERHRDSLLAVQREGAEARIELLRAAAERDESLRLENEKKVVEIERRVTNAEIAEIQRRADAVAAGTEARARLEDELAQKKAARDRQRAEQNRRIREDELNEELRLIRRRAEADQTADVAAQGQIDRLRDAVERGRVARSLMRVPGVERDPQTGKLREVQRIAEVEVKTYADAERAIKDIIDRGFQARIDRLNEEIAARTKNNENVDKLVEDRKRLEQEQANAVEDADRRIRETQEERDPAASFERAQRDVSLTRSVAEAQLAMREAMLRAVRNTYGVEKDLVNQRYDLENERITLAGNQAQDELDRREREELAFWRKNLATDREYQQKKLEVQQDYDALRKTEADKTAFEIEALEKERQDELERQNPLSARSLFGDKYADTSEIFGPLAAAIGSVKDLALNAFSQMADGFGQMVESWVNTGSLGEGGVRRLIAGILAQFSRLTFVQGLMELAYAAAGLTHWGRIMYGAPGPHLKAAAFLFAASGAAAVVGRAVAGNSNQQGTASAATGGGGGDAQPNNQQFTFGVGSTPASADARGGVFAEVVNRMEAHIEEQRKINAMQQAFTARVTSHIESLGVTSHEQIVTMGAGGAREAIATAVIDHSGSDDGFNDKLARNLRVG